MTVSTGPKISSWAMVEALSTLANTVGSHVVATIEVLGPATSGGQRGALLHSLGDVALDPVALPARDERAHLGGRVEGITHPDLGEGTGQGLDQLVVTATG